MATLNKSILLALLLPGCAFKVQHTVEVDGQQAAPLAIAAAPPKNSLTWQYIYAMPVAGINFQVYQSKNLSSWTLLTTVNQPPVQLGNNVNNMYFRVRACSGANCSDYGTSSTTPPPPPAYPTSLTLSWNASPTPGVNDYKVYRGTASGSYSTVFDLGKVATSYVDPSITPGLVYYYVTSSLVTTNPAGHQESTRSNEASFTPTNAPAPPYAVQIVRQ